MKYRSILSWMAVFTVVLTASQVQAQSILERLERRLMDVLPIERPAPPVREPVARHDDRFGVTVHQAGRPDEGLVVDTVAERSPADRAGLRRGDRIIRLGGRDVTSARDLYGGLATLEPGAAMEVLFMRGGLVQSALIQRPRRGDLGRGDDRFGVQPLPRGNAPSNFETIDGGPTTARPALGVNVLDLTPELRRQYGLTVYSGAVISTIVKGSPAEKAGLPIGAAIVAIDGQRVDSSADLGAMVRRFRVGDEVSVTYYEGRRLNRTRVKLEQAATTTARPDTGRPLPVPNETLPRGGSGDLPALGRVENLIDRFVPRDPRNGGAAPIPVDRAEFETLHRIVHEQQQQIEELQRRLAQLEAQLKKEEPPKK